ncbi:hypothetical protein WDU94_001977 [Cyamophila willieti]
MSNVENSYYYSPAAAYPAAAHGYTTYAAVGATPCMTNYNVYASPTPAHYTSSVPPGSFYYSNGTPGAGGGAEYATAPHSWSQLAGGATSASGAQAGGYASAVAYSSSGSLDGKLLDGMQALGVGSGSEMSMGPPPATPPVKKQPSWASIASQPAKPTTTTTLLVKKKGMPPPPMVPGRVKLDSVLIKTPVQTPLASHPTPPHTPRPPAQPVWGQTHATYNNVPPILPPHLTPVMLSQPPPNLLHGPPPPTPQHVGAGDQHQPTTPSGQQQQQQPPTQPPPQTNQAQHHKEQPPHQQAAASHPPPSHPHAHHPPDQSTHPHPHPPPPPSQSGQGRESISPSNHEQRGYESERDRNNCDNHRPSQYQGRDEGQYHSQGQRDEDGQGHYNENEGHYQQAQQHYQNQKGDYQQHRRSPPSNGSDSLPPQQQQHSRSHHTNNNSQYNNSTSSNKYHQNYNKGPSNYPARFSSEQQQNYHPQEELSTDRELMDDQQQPPAHSLQPLYDVDQVIADAQNLLEELKLKNNYNPDQYELPANTRFFVIKSYSEDDIHRSIKYSIWCSTDHGNQKLDQAYRERLGVDGAILLFFSVNKSGHFCGVARMMSPVDYNASSSVWSQDKWKGQFRVQWIYVKDVPNSH